MSAAVRATNAGTRAPRVAGALTGLLGVVAGGSFAVALLAPGDLGRFAARQSDPLLAPAITGAAVSLALVAAGLLLAVRRSPGRVTLATGPAEIVLGLTLGGCAYVVGGDMADSSVVDPDYGPGVLHAAFVAAGVAVATVLTGGTIAGLSSGGADALRIRPSRPGTRR